MVTPYFIPGKWLEDALSHAVAKDVKVELHLPRRSDMEFVDHISRYYAARAVNYGVRVFLSPVMNHAKAMLIDDSEGLVGSGNLDPTSFKLNNEIGVFFSDEHAIARLRETIVNWSAESSPFEEVSQEFHWWQAILTRLLRIFSPAF